MASNLFRPGDLWDVEGSPPSRCSTTSVVRFRLLHLLIPATYLLSHFKRNLKFLYGSRRVGLAGNIAITVVSSGLQLTGHLLDLNHNKFGWIERGEPNQNVHDALVDAGLGIILRVALHEVSLLRRRSLECTLQEQSLHEGADIEADL